MQIFADVAQAIREADVPRGSVAIFWLGQAAFVYKGPDGAVVAVDPFFSDIVYQQLGWSRLWPPPFPAADLRADVVVFSHDHIDHYDPESVAQIARASPHTVFVGPDSCMEHARRDGISPDRLVPLQPGGTALVKGIPITAVHAEHLTVGDPAADAIGPLVELGGVRLYHTGDTVYTAALQAAGRRLAGVHVLLVPINGNYAVLNSLDAALYTRDVAPEVVIPMHYGMFANNTADPYLFVRDLRQVGAASRPVILSPGSCFLYRAP